jgi:hypothetical protein
MALAAATRSVERPQLGYTLSIPADWALTGPVQATEFASRAVCESAEIVDFRPPDESGPSAVVLHSFVQICAVPLTLDDVSLEAFMRRSYGEEFPERFRPIALGGVPAFRAATASGGATVFLQTKSHRLQIVSAVVADPSQRPQRLVQVEEILRSFSVVE